MKHGIRNAVDMLQIPPLSCTTEVEMKKKEEEGKKQRATDIVVKTADPLEYSTLTKMVVEGILRTIAPD